MVERETSSVPRLPLVFRQVAVALAGGPRPCIGRGRRITGVILCIVLAVPLMQAQTAPDLAQVNRYAGRRVAVYDVAGPRVRGLLVGATTSGITLTIDGSARAIDVANIASVTVLGDGIWDGVLKGVGIGALLTLLGHAGTPSCDTPCFRKSALSDVLGIAAVGAIGGWIDARHSREQVVYMRP